MRLYFILMSGIKSENLKMFKALKVQKKSPGKPEDLNFL
jgi:hypothetical protein